MMPSCQNITCRADQFQCADKSCIAGHFHCSGKAECRDGSDELNCRKLFFYFNDFSSLFQILNFYSQLFPFVNVTAKRNSIAVVECAFR
jgi:hypothetical protein